MPDGTYSTFVSERIQNVWWYLDWNQTVVFL